MLDMNVNMCMFMSAGMMDDGMMDDGMMDDGMMDDGMMDDGMPMLSCNGMMVGELDGMAGEFRIFNNTLDGQVDANEDETLADGDPTNEPNFVSSDGAERGGLGILREKMADGDGDGGADAGGQVPAEALNAIGLVFSYFMGTDGMQYDQASPIQSISIPTLMTDANTVEDDERMETDGL